MTAAQMKRAARLAPEAARGTASYDADFAQMPCSRQPQITASRKVAS
jgi:hypothetical protein